MYYTQSLTDEPNFLSWAPALTWIYPIPLISWYFLDQNLPNQYQKYNCCSSSRTLLSLAKSSPSSSVNRKFLYFGENDEIRCWSNVTEGEKIFFCRAWSVIWRIYAALVTCTKINERDHGDARFWRAVIFFAD